MKLEKSIELYTKGKKNLVGAVNSPVRAFKSVGGVPIFIDSAKGSKITDVDGNEYVDMVLSYGPMILGHRNSFVEKTIKKYLKKGYTLALDCDVSEKTFSQKYGVAVEPKNIDENEKAMTYIVEEKSIKPEYRQQEFENYNTTDDHLMHLVGLVKDQNNKEYYKVKNSWGTTGDRIGNGGYIYMSKAYFKLKTISVLVNKKALNETVLKELKI